MRERKKIRERKWEWMRKKEKNTSEERREDKKKEKRM